jgi:hypothetical protein
MCRFDTESIVFVMCSKQLRKKRNGKTPIEFLKKQYKMSVQVNVGIVP